MLVPGSLSSPLGLGDGGRESELFALLNQPSLTGAFGTAAGLVGTEWALRGY